jgi:predicted ArsR family transcriptional regulator
MQRLALLKALGDNTRYAIYLEIARAATPCSTSEIAESLGLHANTVRPHLERMRDVGLLDVEADARGAVGRPQHRYFVAPDAPSLGLEPPAYPALAAMLATVAAQSSAAVDEIVEVGRAEGRARTQRALSEHDIARPTDASTCRSSLESVLAALGFDPATDADSPASARHTIAFAHCPYRELAEAFPHLVCQLHRGMVEGMLDRLNEEVVSADDGADEVVLADQFHSLIDRDPCQVDLVTHYIVS